MTRLMRRVKGHASSRSRPRRFVAMKLSVVCSLMFALASVAHAEGWDSKGWVKLGEREVNGKFDHDKISFPKWKEKLSKLTLYVEKSDLELIDFEITFGNGEKFHPEVHHFFKEGARTRVIDLPGDE